MHGIGYTGSKDYSNIQGSSKLQSPSNIALVKYWGKHGHQLPRNPSISFTLEKAHTTTEVLFKSKDPGEDIDLAFYFEGEKNVAFRTRILSFLEKNQEFFPYIYHFSWTIKSTNSFPHSSGIASSASAMSALIMNFCHIEQTSFNANYSQNTLLKRASFLSRLASGSACRSVYPQLALWGQLEGIKESSDLFAVPMAHNLHDNFKNYHDDILIVSENEKSVSSSAGHKLMDNNLYAQTRFDQARTNTVRLIAALRSGDIDTFIEIVESEALTLHALMMTGQPSFILMKPNTLRVIEAIRSFRQETGVPICFTLDAGPNVHILYPDDVAETCQSFIQEKLKPFAVDGRIISDRIGMGPVEES